MFSSCSIVGLSNESNFVILIYNVLVLQSDKMLSGGFNHFLKVRTYGLDPRGEWP